MATVFMKWLETSPKDYDRGIQLLTLGRLKPLKKRIARDYVREGMRILEIGCGTGTLTEMMARRGGVVSAIDASPAMLAEAERKLLPAFEGQVTLEQLDATQITDHFQEGSFELIVSTLVFSELSGTEQGFVLEACAKLLAPGGRLIIADEVIPERKVTRLPFYLIRLPLVLLTWLLTRTTTAALLDFEHRLQEAGYDVHIAASHLGGSLVLFEGSVMAGEQQPSPAGVGELPPGVAGRLQHRITLRSLLLDFYLLFNRIIPPYPKITPGRYAVGCPTDKSPVLVTGNFDLTVRRVVRAIDGRVDAWLLVADSAGINVWCAAGGGYFTAEKVIAAVKSAHLDRIVKHHALILPQLCANGVDGWKIRQATGWGVHWGPARARDIPAYLESRRKKTDAMRWMDFPLPDRLEMVTVTLAFYGLLILLPVLIFWRNLFWPITASLVGISYFYAVFHPWLPGKDGLVKSAPLALIVLAGLYFFQLFNPMPVQQLFNWGMGLAGLSVFTGAELQGMSPLMRGEQANWGWEALIGAILALGYWLLPWALGWR